MNDELRRLMAEEAAAAEAEPDEDDGQPLPPHVKVSRPGHARSKVLQVRLNPEEFEALEQLAAQRGLPASTMARAHLLTLLSEPAPDPLQRLASAAREFAAAGGDSRAATMIVFDNATRARLTETLVHAMREQSRRHPGFRAETTTDPNMLSVDGVVTISELVETVVQSVALDH